MKATRVDFARTQEMPGGREHDTTIRDGVTVDERVRVVRVGTRNYPFETVNFYDLEAKPEGSFPCDSPGCEAVFKGRVALANHRRKHVGK